MTKQALFFTALSFMGLLSCTPSPQKQAEKLAQKAVMEFAKDAEYKSISFSEMKTVMTTLLDEDAYVDYIKDSIAVGSAQDSYDSACYIYKITRNKKDKEDCNEKLSKLDEAKRKFESSRKNRNNLIRNFKPTVKAYTIEHKCKIFNAMGTYTNSTMVIQLNKELTKAEIIDQKDVSYSKK